MIITILLETEVTLRLSFSMDLYMKSLRRAASDAISTC
jgi:hypothetical protein